MPIYEITSPDGQVFEITAPEGVSEQELYEYAQSNIPTQETAPVQEAPVEQVGRLDALGKGVLDTATIGFSDEIQAAIAAGSIGAQRLMGMDTADLTPAQAYDLALEDIRKEQELAKGQRGGYYTAGQIAGSLLPVTGGAKAVQGASAASRTAKGIGAGMGWGGVYGFGSGQGSDRIFDAGTGAALGGLGGGIGMGVSEGIRSVAQSGLAQKAIRPLAQRAKDAFVKKQVAPVDESLRKVSKGQDDIFSMTKGQRTQLPEAQRLEAEAIGGVYGDQAERMARQALVAQSRERGQFLKQLGDIERTGNANDIVEGVFDTIKSQSKKLKGKVDNAYALAREGGGVKVSTDDIKDGLFATIAGVKREGQFDLNAMPNASSRVKELAKLVRKSQGGRFTNAKLSELENWRKRISNSIASTQDRSEKKFLGEMLNSYDEFMYKTANEAADLGDKDAIMAFRDAVSKRREYGKLYESNKFVDDLVNKGKDIDDAVKDLLGTGSIVGKKRMESTYDAIINAAGKERDLVKQDLQAGFSKKLLQQSIEGLEAGGDAPFLSAAKTKNALEGLFINNKNFAVKLFGEENRNAALKAISELEQISKTQASTQNAPGSGYTVIRALNKIPFVNMASKSFEEAGKQVKAGNVQKNLAEVIGGLEITPQSKLFRPKTTGVAATAVDPSVLEVDIAVPEEVTFKRGEQ